MCEDAEEDVEEVHEHVCAPTGVCVCVCVCHCQLPRFSESDLLK